MACKNICKLCKRLVLSTAVTFSAGALVVTLPAGSYLDGEKYCIVVAQAIPGTATINAPVVITIGDGTTRFPWVNDNGVQLTASFIRTRTKYATVVATTAAGGAFRMIGHVCCNGDRLTAIDGET